MGDLLIRGVGEDVVRRLKSKAQANGTSLQAEARAALTRGAHLSREDLGEVFSRLDRLWGDEPRSALSAAEIVRETRAENGW